MRVVIGVVISASLLTLLARCAPNVGPVTMSAIVTYESGARPFAIGDNTARRAYFPSDATQAENIAKSLLRAGHDIDVGYAQINSTNFARFGLDVRDAFEPCTNVATGARILMQAYAGATHRYGPGQVALAHALSAYNTGGYFAGLGYARKVYATAATLQLARLTPVAPVPRRAVTFTRSRAALAARHRFSTL